MTTTAVSGSTPRVRPAERADLLAVHRIEQESFPQPWPFIAFEQYLSEPGFLVAHDDAVVGFVVGDAIIQHGQLLGHIKDIAVRDDRRGEGIGALLLERALGVLTAEGARAVKLEVRESNDRAISLYRSYDFKQHHTVTNYYDDGEDALVLLRSAGGGTVTSG